VLLAEEELAVEVGEVDCVKVNLPSARGEDRGRTMKISLKLWRHSVLRSSQPMPPAPTSSARVSLNDMARRGGEVERERFRVAILVGATLGFQPSIYQGKTPKVDLPTF
jgi:hypothetical protein